ncbi:TQXA domain-containing protein [Catenulispora sp. MAP12-49]|uniref:thioester domain-containing protein n=1 Tax=Catenulispora sp. MAP12-49 TaxID=3156302 RepID=UPI003511B8E0
MLKPTSSNGRRIAAAMFLGAASTAMVAGTAHADGVTGATVDPHYQHEGTVVMNDDPQAPTALIGLDVPGSDSTLWTYCIQQTVALNPHETYDEHAWSEEAERTGIDTQHLEGIKWILNNSFPQQKNLDQLGTEAGVNGSLSAEEAVEGTQAAIWTFADPQHKSRLDTDNEPDTKVVSLYNWLISQATGHMNDTAQPKAALGITQTSSAKPQAGAKVGFTLTSTPGASISVSLDAEKTGAKLVDAGGKAVTAHTTFKNGDVVYVQLPTTPATGQVSLSATSTVSGIEAGRVFLSHDGRKSQNLILAQAQSTPVSASAELAWTPATAPVTTPSSSPSTAPSSHPSSSTPSTPASTTPSTTPSSPTGGLAHTGAGNTVPLAGGAVALVAAGGGMMLYTRRTRKQGSHS